MAPLLLARAGDESLLARAVDAVMEATVAPSFSRLGPVVRRPLFEWAAPPADALQGRVAVVTGATSGIGAALADDLAALGAHVHVVGRDPDKVAHTVGEIGRRHHGAQPTPQVADMGRLDDVAALAERIAGAEDHVDVLAHVAGALVHERQTTTDGIELTLQVHVVAPHLLTTRLLSSLVRADDARVVTMTSGGMYARRLDVDALVDPPSPFGGTRTYAAAKRAQVELNHEWALRHAGDGVGFHVMHPGWVDTPGLTAGLPGFARWLRPSLRSPDQGADTAAWLAWTPAVGPPGGDLWHDRRRRRTVVLPWTRTPAGEAERLWATVSALAGVDDEVRW